MDTGLLAQTEPQDWVAFLKEAGLLGGAIGLIWMLLTERLVPGSVHRRRVDESFQREKEWRDIATGALDRVERAVEILKEAR